MTTITHDKLDDLRCDYLHRVQESFGRAIDVVQAFRDLSKLRPDDTELRGLTEILCGVLKSLLNTVTVKVAANGMAADWEKLFGDCTHGESE